MKYIHYDAEGDILSVVFAEGAQHTGVEISDNIVLYYDPETGEPLGLILSSYRAMLYASVQAPLPLAGLARAPANVRRTLLAALQRAPLTSFIQLTEPPGTRVPSSRLSEIFSPAVLQVAV
jgi:hypothetical protein